MTSITTAAPSSRHSINRVKRSLAFAQQFKTRRAACHRIACLKFLGRWGVRRPVGGGICDWPGRSR
jgi:hypothetical protein